MPPLPSPRTPLIGREHELRAACSLLECNGVRLLTVTGPAGLVRRAWRWLSRTAPTMSAE